MLSRFAIKQKSVLPALTLAVRNSSITTGDNAKNVSVKNSSITQVDGVRDEVNFPRRKIPIYPEKVRLAFLPDSWFQYFYNRTGVTGPYIFGGGLLTFLLSKEYLIVDHEFVTGIGLFIIFYIANRVYGKSTKDYLKREIEKEDKELDCWRDNKIEAYRSEIEEAKANIQASESNPLIYDAKKENIGLQLEAAYRERLAHVYKTIKNRMDFQLEIDNIKTRMEHKHMVDWIVSNVRKSITPTQEAATMKQCLSDLKALSAKA